MKDSKDKEHRISNLKDMIDNIKDVDEQSTLDNYDDIEEDEELINYLNEDKINYDDYEINDEFIYRPDDEDTATFDLEENQIDEDYIIKTKMFEEPEDIEVAEGEEDILDYDDEIESFDNVLNAKIGKTSILAILSTLLGLLLIVASATMFNSRSDRIIDNVVSGETNFIGVVLLIFGLLLLIYGIYHVFSIKNPFENISSSINSIDKEEEAQKKTPQKIEDEPPIIPKSNIPLDKDSYKIGEFDMDELKTQLKKPASSKKSKQTKLDDIPPAKEKSTSKKPTAEEIEHDQTVLDGESIDEIFAGVEDIPPKDSDSEK